jgi:hypothetical protein
MDTRKQLLREIKAFARESGLSTKTIGRYAVENSHLVARLEAGGEVTSATIDKVMAYIAAERAKRGKKSRSPLERVCPA